MKNIFALEHSLCINRISRVYAFRVHKRQVFHKETTGIGESKGGVPLATRKNGGIVPPFFIYLIPD